MKTEYHKTDDPNIFVKSHTSESFIHLDKLIGDIEAIQRQIADLPKPKTEPDQETLDCYNMEMEMHGEKEMFEMELKEKQDLLAELGKLKVAQAEGW